MSGPKSQRSNRPIPISTQEFDRKVEAGEDIDDHLDWENARTILPGDLTRRQELAVLREKMAMMQNMLQEMLAAVDQFEEHEALK